MRGWRMGEGGGADGNDESEAESTSPWDTGGARAGGRGNRGGNARDSEPRAPSRRYADDEPGDYGSFDDDDGFDSRSSRGGGYDRRPRGGGGRGGRGRGGGRGMRGRGATRGRGRRDSAYADEDDSSSSTGYDDDDVDGDGRTRWQSRHDEKKANRRENGVLTLAERLVGEAVYGRNPVLAMLGADRRDVSGIWIQEGSDASRDKALLKAAAARGITPEYASKHDLNMLTGGGSRPHNGVVADASPLTPIADGFASVARWVHARCGAAAGVARVGRGGGPAEPGRGASIRALLGRQRRGCLRQEFGECIFMRFRTGN